MRRLNAKKSKKSPEEKQKPHRATATKKAQFAHEKNEKNQLDQIFKTGDHIPSEMLDAFLYACEQINENTTDMENPSNHALWKKVVAPSELDFDWAAWIVLRTIYYDQIAKSTKPEDIKFKAGFMTNNAAMKIQERYNCEKFFTAQLPNDISAPRPPE
ncbi:hypothetical protein NW752_004417 [Fusarium irregulare]|uniref:Uncharacterized protein n=1 Tax=Fusarium irregulare TaxID=2494466 RepID=A0A9W8U9K0_9HYPO|nr:hypothetical protein NW766_007324 [Fusarium irregulare]KAJ4021409.1 hypothetical protein NW752_004417 [Fusarium irregulare]